MLCCTVVVLLSKFAALVTHNITGAYPSMVAMESLFLSGGCSQVFGALKSTGFPRWPHTHTRMQLRTHTPHTHTCTRTHTCTHTHLQQTHHTLMHTYSHIHAHTHRHTHIHTHSHAHTHMYEGKAKQNTYRIKEHTSNRSIHQSLLKLFSLDHQLSIRYMKNHGLRLM